MPPLTDINQLRAVEWGAAYLWDLQFPAAPSPFKDWFPAADVTEGIANLESHPFESSQHTFKVPKSGTMLDISITFFDDAKNTLLYWLEGWINNEILNRGKGITPVKDCVKQLDIKKFNSRREIVKSSSYFVYPEGALAFSGKTASEAHMYTVNFVIVGTSGGQGPISA